MAKIKLHWEPKCPSEVLFLTFYSIDSGFVINGQITISIINDQLMKKGVKR